jgi:hypothetical protein
MNNPKGHTRQLKKGLRPSGLLVITQPDTQGDALR